MQIELGTNQLTTKQYYQIIYQNAQLQLDTTVEARFKTAQEYKLPEIQSKQQQLIVLLYLLNTDNSCLFEQLQQILEDINANTLPVDNQKVQTCEKIPLNLTKTIDIFAVSQLALPLIILNFAFFNELTNASCKSIDCDYLNHFKNGGLRQLADSVKYLNLNSKKVNLKKSNDLIEHFLVQTAQFGEIVQQQRLGVRQLLNSQLAPLQFSQNELFYGEKLEFLLKEQIQFSKFKKQLFKEKFTVQNNIWRGIDFSLQDYKNFQQQNDDNLITVLLDELKAYMSELKNIQKLQIGQALILLIPQLQDKDILEISQLVESTLQTQSASRRVPQPPTGTRDFDPKQCFSRSLYKNQLLNICKKHGAVEIETPAFETRAVLMEKYGDDQKLIYQLEDFGEEQLALRYDLTVPFSRYCVTHNVKQIKRFQFGRVYRRDKPNFEKGRFREFYQLDFDIGGDEGVQNDAEVLCVNAELINVFTQEYTIIVNHRGILNQIIQHSGIGAEKFKAVCSVIDQLDKCPVEEVRKKLIFQKGISEKQANLLLQIISLSCNAVEIQQFIELMRKEHNELFLLCEANLKEMEQIFQFIQKINANVIQNIKLDFSLARGLEYYTGMIFEGKLNKGGASISGGGRYDNLLESINPSAHMPVVGGSVGVERLFALLQLQTDQEVQLDIMVCSAPGGLLEKRMEIYGRLIAAGFKVGCNFRDGASMKSLKRDLEEAFSTKSTLAVIVGAEECASGKWAVRRILEKQTEQFQIEDNLLEKYCLAEVGNTNPAFYKQYIHAQLEKVQKNELTLEQLLELTK